MINLFIDTNIYLNFYYFSNEDLAHLEQLENLIEKNVVRIYLPDQVVDEFYRNRETKINDALQRLRKNIPKTEIPLMIIDYPDIEEFKKLERDYHNKKRDILRRLENEINTNSLKADKIIESLFYCAETITITDEIYRLANKRCRLGNPPGKKGSIGDAINWETLIGSVPDTEDIYLISEDTDYISNISKNQFSFFLAKEWHKKKSSGVYFYQALHQFLSDKFPDIILSSEELKDSLITSLEDSVSFDEARKYIYKLYQKEGFTNHQINRIITASITNNQIYNAHKYSPKIVGERLKKIIEGHEEQIPQEDYQNFSKYFEIKPKYNTDMKVF